MNFKKIIGLYMLTMLLLVSCSTLKQTNKSANKLDAVLKNLTLTDMTEIETVPLDGESVPFYSIEGERIPGMEIMNFLTSTDYKLAPYIDEEKVLKVFVFRPATAEEKLKTENARKEKEEAHKLLNKDAIDFTVKDIQGENYSLESLKDKIIVLNFWFTSCKPCLQEIPDLNKLVAKYKNNKEIVFLGFAKNNDVELNAFLEKTQFDYTLIPVNKSLIEDYKVTAYPTSMIINQTGKIALVTESYSSTTVKNIEDKIDELLEK